LDAHSQGERFQEKQKWCQVRGDRCCDGNAGSKPSARADGIGWGLQAALHPSRSDWGRISRDRGRLRIGDRRSQGMVASMGFRLYFAMENTLHRKVT
jgi:hypothetical protein